MEKRIKHWKDTLEHVRRVQDNLIRVCELIQSDDQEFMDVLYILQPDHEYTYSRDFLIVNLLQRALVHDLSKFSPDEWSAFAEANYGDQLSKFEYGSPEYMEQLKTILGPALENHYRENDHHPEHYRGKWQEKMTLAAVIEMLCDWEAATHRHETGDIWKSVEKNAERFGYDEDTIKYFNWFYEYLLGDDAEV